MDIFVRGFFVQGVLLMWTFSHAVQEEEEGETLQQAALMSQHKPTPDSWTPASELSHLAPNHNSALSPDYSAAW